MSNAKSPQQALALTVEQALHQAIAHHQAGQLQDAERLYRAILQAQPNQPDANHNLGVLACQVGQHTGGLPYLKTALAINPAQGEYALSYAEALLATGQARAALNIIQVAMLRGFNTPAAQALRQNAEAAALHGTAKVDAPASIEINQLAALFNAGRHGEMESLARLLVERYPDSGVAWKALGLAVYNQGKDALAAALKATELLPDDAEAHGNLGNVMRDLRRFDDALVSYRRALEINPDYAKVHSNLGATMHDIGQLDAAVASYRRAMEINPDFTDAYSNLGVALKDLGQLDEAVAIYRRALEINPDFTDAYSNLLFIHNYQSEQTAPMLLAEAQRFGELVARKARPYSDWQNLPISNRCLRVGLVSGDMYSHPVGFFLEGVLEALASHAAGRLKFIAYPTHFRTDALTERIKACCHGWHSALGLSDESLARLVRDDAIDILIDLSGHTAYNRLPLFAWKPAPVQVTWLGYLATTGMGAIDYLIADTWTLPETDETFFTEKIWRLPETYLCFTPPEVDIDVTPLPALTKGYVTFGSFNNLTKMNDEVVALWSRVLTAVPGSRLCLKAPHINVASIRQSIFDRFGVHGIGPERLILKEVVPRTEYLAPYQEVDVALDPFPYPGITTSVESLWMGVPVLTLAGDRFVSRQGVGLLTNAGLPEWIAADSDDYVARAVSHTSNLQRLAALRGGLRQQVLASPIFDAHRFARHFEEAMRGMWTQWCNHGQG